MTAREVSVYRLYDEGGRLLYVGMAYDVDARQAAHKATKQWWPQVSRVEVEQFATRSEAAAVERVAIATEGPRYNVTGTPGNPGGRPTDHLPAAVAAELRVAKASAEAAHAELKAAVRDALKVGSVRQVAAALGISPTTVQAWARPTD